MRLIGLFLLTTTLSACCSIQETPCARHYAICNELKRQVMYAGASGNQQVAMQQRSLLERLNQALIQEGC